MQAFLNRLVREFSESQPSLPQSASAVKLPVTPATAAASPAALLPAPAVSREEVKGKSEDLTARQPAKHSDAAVSSDRSAATQQVSPPERQGPMAKQPSQTRHNESTPCAITTDAVVVAAAEAPVLHVQSSDVGQLISAEPEPVSLACTAMPASGPLAGWAIAAVTAAKQGNVQPEAAAGRIGGKHIAGAGPMWQTPVKPVRAGPAQCEEAARASSQLIEDAVALAPVTPEKQDVTTPLAGDLLAVPTDRQRTVVREQPAMTRSRMGAYSGRMPAIQLDLAPLSRRLHQSSAPVRPADKVQIPADFARPSFAASLDSAPTQTQPASQC